MFNGINILDFSPSRNLFKKFRKLDNINYFSTDISGDFIAEYSFDINNISSEDNKFNLILCFHILEHIQDDIKAMQELYRILITNGHCLIQTPFKEGSIYENPNIIEPKERLHHFGQEDHVRIYSLQGLAERLRSVGFIVEIRSYKDTEENIYGFKKNENIIVCKKIA